MKSVISASRRTDIPAFYLKWFMERIQAGGLSVRNPLYRKNIKYVDLSPKSVEWIVFWSRNYNHFLQHRSFFKSYKLFFHFTTNSPHPVLEKRYIRQTTAIKQAELLAHTYGGNHIIWRYDPIVFWQDGTDLNSNLDISEFREYCRLFSSFGINRCYFSFVAHYPKFLRRFKKKYPFYTLIHPPSGHRKQTLDVMKEHASDYNIKLFSCCNNDLVDDVILPGECISGKLLNNLTGKKVVNEAKFATRTDCGCTRSIDIGDYVTQPCYFGCIYCYANPVWK